MGYLDKIPGGVSRIQGLGRIQQSPQRPLKCLGHVSSRTGDGDV